MLIRREGYPEEGEILYCKVTKINPHTVFVNIVEYDKGGLINISEISPGRIRNIRDYVSLGRYIVCKVLRVNPEKGHIDLSLRRVTEQQRRQKIQEVKQEQRAEKIIEFIAKEQGKEPEELFGKIWKKIKDEYYYLYEFFQDIVEEKRSIEELGLDKKTSKRLKEIIEERIKPKEVEIHQKIKITSTEPDGIEIIKNALIGLEKHGFIVTYLGGSKYLIRKKAKDYKEAERQMKTEIEKLESLVNKKANIELIK